ncbi:MAG: hypothetical protein FJ083_12430 [Cyanobacteria bacterium K_Offshore_surface_m2_239]|nr:hypothetical protein [Cyanobacteria bacterium K_Offshore_surface_m2_239]
MDPACAKLVHSTEQRWRYRLQSATPLDWQRLDTALAEELPSGSWSWRVNPRCQSVILEVRAEAPWPPVDARSRGWRAVLAAMDSAGATAPSPPVLKVRVRSLRQPPRAPLAWLLAPLNLASLALSLTLLGLAALLAVLGALGLLLPLLPGVPFLVLAFLLAELAFRLRRPFVASASVPI